MKGLFSYTNLDHAKIIAQQAARETEENIAGSGWEYDPISRGESASIYLGKDIHIAHVEEGLGTKNRIVDFVDGNLYSSSWDTVATIINDLITSGAYPLGINAKWSFGASSWLIPERAEQLIHGWRDACNEARAVYGGGETQTLSTIIYPDTIELSGSGIGIISPKSNYIFPKELRVNDHIILIESSGIEANGITPIREQLVHLLKDGYDTKMSSGKTFGEALLTRTFIYARLQSAILEAGVDVHRIENITGHGLRKLMRSRNDFTYRLKNIPTPQEEFLLIQEVGGIPDDSMYSTYNMGAGFAFFVDKSEVSKTQEITTKCGFKSWDAGVVEKGPKKVIIEPKGIVFKADSLKIR